MHRSEEPRIPTSSPGSSMQGAFRRDFCLISDCDGYTHWLSPLCEAHMVEAWRWVEARPEIRPLDVELRRQRERKQAENAALAAERAARVAAERALLSPVVYYIKRRSGSIKIGTTTQLNSRMNGLRAEWEHVLAVEWGGREVEAERHVQFANDRLYSGASSSEEFTPSAALLAHIKVVREANGEPRAMLDEQYRRNKAVCRTAAG